MALTGIELIDLFLEGATEGKTGTKNNPGNLSIRVNQLIHYNTPILERTPNGFLLNKSRYSLATGQLQKKIREKLVSKDIPFSEVKAVPSNYPDSLIDFYIPKQVEEV